VRVIRIVLSIHHHLRRGTGAPGVTLRIAEGLRARGHEVHVLGFEILGRDYGPTGNAIRFPRAAARAVMRLDPDVWDASSGDAAYCPPAGHRPWAVLTRSHGLEHLAWAAKRARLGRLAPQTVLYHGVYRLREIRRAFVRADRALVLNAQEAEVVRGWGMAPDRVVVTRNPVDPSFFGLAPHLPPDPPTVLYVGSLEARKGTGLLLEAAEAVWEQRSDARFVLVGDGEDAAAAQKAAARSGGRLVCLGRRPPEELPPMMAAASLLVLPSDFEGASVTLTEAMAACLPVVAARTGHAPDVLGDGGAGRLLPKRTPKALAGAILEVLALSAPAWRTMAAAARAAALPYSTEAVARHLEDVYRTALPSRR
jgi:glycosyltransferase involved in cell wall biosynthesis